ncbi:hypothetical protein VULLAG_LOCUS7020 [Vulpes lagopus]
MCCKSSPVPAVLASCVGFSNISSLYPKQRGRDLAEAGHRLSRLCPAASPSAHPGPRITGENAAKHDGSGFMKISEKASHHILED